MPLGNSPTTYGAVERGFHWLTALLILTAFPLGLIANSTAMDSDASIARAFLLFSLHKSVGILAFALGIARILWVISQTRPSPVRPERRLETAMADVVHWLLYGGMVLVPLTGWLTHSASPPLAPIWLPLAGDLPLVPKDARLAETFAGIHWLLTKVLAVAVILHVAGALKHAFVDRDGVLARMWRGTAAGPGGTHRTPVAALSALAIWALALAGGIWIGLSATSGAAGPPVVWVIDAQGVALVGPDGTELGEIPAADVTLSLAVAPDGGVTGALDIFAALDSFGGDGADALFQTLVIPVAQYAGAIEGTTPVAEARGVLDVGGLTENATFAVEIEGTTAIVSGTAIIPGAPDFTLAVSATARAP